MVHGDGACVQRGCVRVVRERPTKQRCREGVRTYFVCVQREIPVKWREVSQTGMKCNPTEVCVNERSTCVVFKCQGNEIPT